MTSSLRSLDLRGIRKTSWQTEVSMLLVSVLGFFLWKDGVMILLCIQPRDSASTAQRMIRYWFMKKWIFRSWRYCRHTLPQRKETLKESWKSVLCYLLTISPLRLRIRGSKDVVLFVSGWERWDSVWLTETEESGVELLPIALGRVLSNRLLTPCFLEADAALSTEDANHVAINTIQI